MSVAWRSFSAMAARSISSLISAQSAETNVVLYREYKLRPELVETGDAPALPYTVTRICLLPLHGSFFIKQRRLLYLTLDKRFQWRYAEIHAALYCEVLGI